jgi:hypothetical protein
MDEMGQPTDLYLKFRERLLEDSAIAAEHRESITRDFCKPPVMVRGYGAGSEAIRRDLIAHLESVKDRDESAVIRELVGDTEGRSILLDDVMAALDSVVGGMGEVTSALRDAVAKTAAEARSVYWKTQDGFPVELVGKVLQDVCYDVLHLAPPSVDYDGELNNRRWVLRNELGPMIDYPKSASAVVKGVAPSFVHSIDGNHIRIVVNNAEASIVHTHDEVGTHPEDFFEVNTLIRQTFVQLHTEFDWFGSLEEHTRDVESVNCPQGTYNVRDALEATYLFS